MPLLLVTGAGGEVARGVLPHLEKDFELRLLDLAPVGDDPRRLQVDLLDWEALARAMNGVDAVLHLAVASGHSGTFEDDAVNDGRFDVNVKGTFHVFETARRLRIKRVVYVSSIMVTWGHALLNDAKVAGDEKPLPVGTYALTKTMGEGIARYYGMNLDLEGRVEDGSGRVPRRRDKDRSPALKVITVRIAAPLDVDDPHFRDQPVRPQQVPLPDLAQAFRLALTVPLRGYQVVTIVGVSSLCRWDLEAAQRVLGYRPQYYLDDLGVTFADPFAVEKQ